MWGAGCAFGDGYLRVVTGWRIGGVRPRMVVGVMVMGESGQGTLVVPCPFVCWPAVIELESDA